MSSQTAHHPDIHADALERGIAHYLSFVTGDAADKAAVLQNPAQNTAGALFSIGDTEYDIPAAHRAGAIPIAFTADYRPATAFRDTRPTALIDDFSTLSVVLLHTRHLPALLTTLHIPPERCRLHR